MLALIAPSLLVIALYNRFRSLPIGLVEEWAAFVKENVGSEDQLGNSALSHHAAVEAFCRRRRDGCTWAEYHAIVDHSREPWAHLFDRLAVEADVPARPTQCVRLHRPSAAELLGLVRRSQPAVLTGIIDEWPATTRWAEDGYLERSFGQLPVTVSVSDNGRFDQPEPAGWWGLPESSETLRGVIARPAHISMRLAEALSAARDSGSNLTAYLEYLPLDDLPVEGAASRRFWADLGGSPGRYSPDAEDGSSTAAEEAATSELADAARGGGEEARRLLGRGLEIGAMPLAAWLMPRKQLLWLGGNATVGSTHYDPYENLMAVVAGKKTFHLASPDEGGRLGAFQAMAEGQLQIERQSERDEARKPGGHKRR